MHACLYAPCERTCEASALASLAELQECQLQAKKGRQVLAFYTMPEYEAWCERTNTQGWAIKYYKGLGTSDAKEAKEYFADIDDHRKTFVWNGEGPAFAD